MGLCLLPSSSFLPTLPSSLLIGAWAWQASTPGRTTDDQGERERVSRQPVLALLTDAPFGEVAPSLGHTGNSTPLVINQNGFASWFCCSLCIQVLIQQMVQIIWAEPV